MPQTPASSNAPSTLQAAQIPVAGWREILIWPIAIEHVGSAAEQGVFERVDKVAKTIEDDPHWHRIDDPLAHASPGGKIQGAEEEAAAFAELVYFHDFIQRSMFAKARDPSGTSDQSPLYLFHRTDIHEARITTLEDDFSSEPPRTFRNIFSVNVVRVILYLFRTGAAVFVIELEWQKSTGAAPLRVGPLDKGGAAPTAAVPAGVMTLAHVLTLRDRIRRAYAPFYRTGGGPSPAPGIVVEMVTWIGSGGELGPFQTSHQWADAQRIVHNPLDRSPPIFQHWDALLPRSFARQPQNISGAITSSAIPWRHIVDERIPNLTWLSLSAANQPLDYYYRRVSRSDWVRLCFVDEAGDGYPYDEDFLSDFETCCCYDRFFSMGTRFLFSGHSFAIVGHGGFFDGYIQGYFRRAYFDMALIAQFEYASLLSFSSRITSAVAHRDSTLDDAVFAQSMIAIQAEFLQFVHRFRLTGVSNQMQGREIFDLLRKHLDLGRLFSDLQSEITTATAFLRAQAQQAQAKAQQLETEAASRLSVVATVGATMGLAFMLLGMNVLFHSDLVAAIFPPTPISWKVVGRHFGVVVAAIGLFGIMMYGLLRYLRGKSSATYVQAKLEALFFLGSIVTVLLATFVLCVSQ